MLTIQQDTITGVHTLYHQQWRRTTRHCTARPWLLEQKKKTVGLDFKSSFKGKKM